MSLEDMQPARTLDDIAASGYSGVQFTDVISRADRRRCESLGLRWCSSGRVNSPDEVSPLARRFIDEGAECATLHVGWGMEDDAEAGALIKAILAEAERIPLFVETHRATVFQDMWRTVQFIRLFPGLRFNGDFSHWYTGSEMVYGGFDKKLAFIQPVVERVRFVHGRIGTPGCIQARPKDCASYTDHFRTLWTQSFAAFLRSAQPGETVLFVPELLSPRIYYGHADTDRWADSLVLCRIARQCYEAAQREFA